MIRVLTAVCAILLSVGQPAAAEPVIKIGILTDMTGIFSDPTGPGSLVAARLAVEDYAASPHKYSVSILSADHQNRADLGSQIARRWLDVDGVSAIFDLPNSAVALAVNEIGRTMNKAVIVSSGGSAALTGSACSPTTVHWTYDNWALANAAVSAVVKSGGDGWFFIVADYAFGTTSIRSHPVLSSRTEAAWWARLRTRSAQPIMLPRFCRPSLRVQRSLRSRTPDRTWQLL